MCRACQPATGKPSRSAAAARRPSRHTNARVVGRPSAAATPAASCRASAARNSWVRRKRSACSRSTSDGCTSCHVAAKRSSRPRAAAAERGRSMLSRSRRAMADSHSTRVPTTRARPRRRDTTNASGSTHAGGRQAARERSCPRTSTAAPALLENGGDDIGSRFGGGGKDAHDLLEPAMARATDDTCSFQPCQTPLVRAGAARAHHWLETRDRPTAIRDQNRLAVSHEIQQRTELVLRLGYRRCLHQAIIAFSTKRRRCTPCTGGRPVPLVSQKSGVD
jgi:hypothetical protein